MQAKRTNTANGARASGEAELRHYRLHERLWQEELATVYRATHTTLDRPVHVYLLRLSDWVSACRFQLAARLSARLSHPHLLPVTDAGHDVIDPAHERNPRSGNEAAKHAYMVTPQIDGQSLEDLLRAGPLAPVLALRIFSQVGQAVDYLHRQGVIHRDIQPVNIRVTHDGIAYLTNLSLAESADTPNQLFSDLHEADYLTAYSAPELQLAAAAERSLDIYSLGAVLYHMLSGEMLPDPNQKPPPLGARDAALIGVDRVLARLLAQDPSQRYTAAAVAAAALRQALRAQIDDSSDDMEESQWLSCAEFIDNPIERALGSILAQDFFSRSHKRADELHRAPVLRKVLNRWSRQGWGRRRALGTLMQPQQIFSYNVYFYTLQAAYETRTYPLSRKRALEEGEVPLGGPPLELWEVRLAEGDLFADVATQEVVLPGSQQLVHCPDCKQGKITCPTCNGLGDVNRQQRVKRPDGSTELRDIQSKCPTCHGYRLQDCPICRGKGHLIEEQVFHWSRRGRMHSNVDDDLEGLPEQLLRVHAETTFKGEIDLRDPQWQKVKPLRELIEKAANEADADTQVIHAELVIAGVPVTQVEYLLGEREHALIIVGFEDEAADNPRSYFISDILGDHGSYDYQWIMVRALGVVAIALICLLVVVFLLR